MRRHQDAAQPKPTPEPCREPHRRIIHVVCLKQRHRSMLGGGRGFRGFRPRNSTSQGIHMAILTVVGVTSGELLLYVHMICRLKLLDIGDVLQQCRYSLFRHSACTCTSRVYKSNTARLKTASNTFIIEHYICKSRTAVPGSGSESSNTLVEGFGEQEGFWAFVMLCRGIGVSY